VIDYGKLSDREIDALVQAALFPPFPEDRCPVCGWELVSDTSERGGCRKGDCSLRPGPDRRADDPREYSIDDNAARMVRDRIVELGLTKEYMVEIAHQVWPIGTPASAFKGADDFSFLMHNATARQQAIAALTAVEKRK